MNHQRHELERPPPHSRVPSYAATPSFDAPKFEVPVDAPAKPSFDAGSDFSFGD
jgi:hypothetical protein